MRFWISLIFFANGLLFIQSKSLADPEEIVLVEVVENPEADLKSVFQSHQNGYHQDLQKLRTSINIPVYTGSYFKQYKLNKEEAAAEKARQDLVLGKKPADQGVKIKISSVEGSGPPPPPPPGPFRKISSGSTFGSAHILAVLKTEKLWAVDTPGFEEMMKNQPPNLDDSYDSILKTVEKDPEVKITNTIYSNDDLPTTQALKKMRVGVERLDLKNEHSSDRINLDIRKNLMHNYQLGYIPRGDKISSAARAVLVSTIHYSESWPRESPLMVNSGKRVKFNGQFGTPPPGVQEEIVDLYELQKGKYTFLESKAAFEVIIPFKSGKRFLSLVLPNLNPPAEEEEEERPEKERKKKRQDDDSDEDQDDDANSEEEDQNEEEEDAEEDTEKDSDENPPPKKQVSDQKRPRLITRVLIPSFQFKLRQPHRGGPPNYNCQSHQKFQANFYQILDDVSFAQLTPNKFDAVTISGGQINNGVRYREEMTPVENKTIVELASILELKGPEPKNASAVVVTTSTSTEAFTHSTTTVPPPVVKNRSVEDGVTEEAAAAADDENEQVQDEATTAIVEDIVIVVKNDENDEVIAVVQEQEDVEFTTVRAARKIKKQTHQKQKKEKIKKMKKREKRQANIDIPFKSNERFVVFDRTFQWAIVDDNLGPIFTGSMAGLRMDDDVPPVDNSVQNDSNKIASFNIKEINLDEDISTHSFSPKTNVFAADQSLSFLKCYY